VTSPRVLLLSTTTGYQLRSFAAAAASLGIDLVYGTDRCHALDDPWRDAALPVRFHEEEASLDAIVRAARTRPLHGVIAVGDRPVELAARAAGALGLPGHPPDAARASAHKRLARERFARAGLPVPPFAVTTVQRGLDAILPHVVFPAVIKPVALSGSRGVIRVDDRHALAEAFGRVARLLARRDVQALDPGAAQELLVERFIPGREYAVEGLLTAGSFTPLAIFDKPDPLDGPFFEETIYVTPSRAEPSIVRHIVHAAAAAARALGLRHGPVHAECRVNADGVFVLEVAARPIGGLCSRVLRFGGGGGTSLEHVLLRHTLGEDVRGVVREAQAAAVMMMPIPARGVFRAVRGEEEARAVPLVEDVQITAKPDQLLEPLPEAAGYLGFIFARGGHAADVEDAVRRAHRALQIVIDRGIPMTAS